MKTVTIPEAALNRILDHAVKNLIVKSTRKGVACTNDTVPLDAVIFEIHMLLDIIKDHPL